MWFLPSCVNAKGAARQDRATAATISARIRHAETIRRCSKRCRQRAAARGGRRGARLLLRYVRVQMTFVSSLRSEASEVTASVLFVRTSPAGVVGPVLSVSQRRSPLPVAPGAGRTYSPSSGVPVTAVGGSVHSSANVGGKPSLLGDARQRLNMRARRNIRLRRLLAQLQRLDVSHDRPAIRRRQSAPHSPASRHSRS